jgi:hypothetical protein
MRFAIEIARLAPPFLAVTAISFAANAQAKDYTVKKGDTCTSIVLAEYGDKRFIDLLHQGNPTMGPTPHMLKEGTVLTLLPKPTPAPDARVDYIRNKVEVSAPTPKPARKDELLFRGNRVSTQEDSAADVLFIASKGLMRLSEHTLVIILDASKGAVGANQPRETTLVTGALRTRLSELAGGGEVINTPAGKVVLGAGETKLDVDAKKTARLAVYKGKGQITAQKKTVIVPENFGAKAEEGKPPTDPKPLPGVPDWSAPPEGVVWVETGPGVARGRFAPATKGAEVASWHLQIARDSDFRQILVDVRVPRSIDSIETKEVTAGPYYFRVSGIDSDMFEGPFSEVKRTYAGKLYWAAKPTDSSGGQFVAAPDMNCTVDGNSLTTTVSGAVYNDRRHPPAGAHARCRACAARVADAASGSRGRGPEGAHGDRTGAWSWLYLAHTACDYRRARPADSAGESAPAGRRPGCL